MTTGALIFAFDTEHTRYLDMAAFCAERVQHFLNIPVAVVTNNPAAEHETVFDRVIYADPLGENSRWFGDLKQHVTWHNSNRVDAYNLSPWDQTLVLDADFVINSEDLRVVLNSSQEFMCFRSAFNLARPEEEFLNTFGTYRYPMYWATVMMFRKGNTAQYIFDSMQMIRENWTHYRDLYHIAQPTYRNDYALSIALGIVSGQTLKVDTIPWGMPSVVPENKLTLSNDTFWDIEYQDAQGKLKTVSYVGLDFHAMGKQDLGEIVETHRRARLCDISLEHTPS
jgi:hypothetical protein